LRLCIDTRKDPDILPGTYVGTAFVEDSRFSGQLAIPITVTLQHPELYRYGVPLVIGVVLGAVFLASQAAESPFKVTGRQLLGLVGLVGVAYVVYAGDAIGNESFGAEHTHWALLIGSVGSAVLAAATTVFAGGKIMGRRKEGKSLGAATHIVVSPNGDDVNLRADPMPSSESIASLSDRTKAVKVETVKVKVKGQGGKTSWSKVKVRIDGSVKQGWVEASCLQPLDKEPLQPQG
jgi:hypothetical protein